MPKFTARQNFPDYKSNGHKCMVGRHLTEDVRTTLNILVRFTMYFRRIFVESMKTIHFWKAYGIGNKKNNVSICPESNMAAILHYKMAAMKHVLVTISAR